MVGRDQIIIAAQDHFTDPDAFIRQDCYAVGKPVIQVITVAQAVIRKGFQDRPRPNQRSVLML